MSRILISPEIFCVCGEKVERITMTQITVSSDITGRVNLKLSAIWASKAPNRPSQPGHPPTFFQGACQQSRDQTFLDVLCGTGGPLRGFLVGVLGSPSRVFLRCAHLIWPLWVCASFAKWLTTLRIVPLIGGCQKRTAQRGRNIVSESMS